MAVSLFLDLRLALLEVGVADSTVEVNHSLLGPFVKLKVKRAPVNGVRRADAYERTYGCPCVGLRTKRDNVIAQSTTAPTPSRTFIGLVFSNKTRLGKSSRHNEISASNLVSSGTFHA